MDRLGARRVRLWACAVLTVLVCSLVAAPGASARSRSAPRGTHYAKITRVCPTRKTGDATCLALARVPVPSAAAGERGVRPYTTTRGALESGPAGGLTPEELASVYGYNPAVGGSGQTIALVDAYDDPKIESDLAAFDAEYGIAACTKANGCFTKVSQTGSATSCRRPTRGDGPSRSRSTSRWPRSACPNCKILLVEAKNESFKNLAAAVDEAVSLRATEVSNSYGGPEDGLGSAELAAYKHPGVVIAAATGDSGYDDWTLYSNEGEPVAAEQPDAPASLPSVVAVGGTTLELNASGKRKSETVWNGNGVLDASEVCRRRDRRRLQHVVHSRTLAAGHARLRRDRLRRQTSRRGRVRRRGSKHRLRHLRQLQLRRSLRRIRRREGWLTIGGTSVSTPLISSLYALAGGTHGVEYPSLTLYGHLGESSSLFDVTEGGNGFCDDGGLACGANELEEAKVDCEGTTACNAAPGFDGPSGVGAPNTLNLFKPLLPVAVLTPPSSLEPGVPAGFSGGTSSDPYPGAVLSYSWSWGDGTAASTGVAPTHTYSAQGEYTVTLTVSDSYGFKSAPATVVVKVATARPKKKKRPRRRRLKKKQLRRRRPKKKQLRRRRPKKKQLRRRRPKKKKKRS